MTETINWNWTRYSTGTDYEDDAESVSVEPPTYDYNILEFTPSTPEAPEAPPVFVFVPETTLAPDGFNFIGIGGCSLSRATALLGRFFIGLLLAEEEDAVPGLKR